MSDDRVAAATFLQKLSNDNSVSSDLKQTAAELTERLSRPSVLDTDVWIYRAVVLILGTAVIATVIGGIGLAFLGNATNYKLPAELVAIGSAAVGALAGLLAPSPRGSEKKG